MMTWVSRGTSCHRRVRHNEMFDWCHRYQHVKGPHSQNVWPAASVSNMMSLELIHLKMTHRHQTVAKRTYRCVFRSHYHHRCCHRHHRDAQATSFIGTPTLFPRSLFLLRGVKHWNRWSWGRKNKLSNIRWFASSPNETHIYR